MIANCFLIMTSCLINRQGRPRKGAVYFMNTLIDNRIPFVILTNQSTYTRAQLAEMMNRAGFNEMIPQMFYTSTMAAVDAICRKYPDKKTAGYIGGKGMTEILKLGGFSLNMNHADWLFVGSDHNATYNDYSYALRLISGGAYIVSTDPVLKEKTTSGDLIGSGSVVKMLESASGTRALEAGIPSGLIVSRSLVYLRQSIDDAVLVTSQPEPEITCGIAAGIRTVLSMSAMDETDNALQRRVQPDFVVEDLTGLMR